MDIFSAVKAGNYDGVKDLIQKGANINEVDVVA